MEWKWIEWNVRQARQWQQMPEHKYKYTHSASELVTKLTIKMCVLYTSLVETAAHTITAMCVCVFSVEFVRRAIPTIG